MSDLNKQDQETLINFARFLDSYNPDFRMAPGMAAQFKEKRDAVRKIIDKVNNV